MKKLTALLLAAALTLTLTLPATAQSGIDAELAAILPAVKEKLDVGAEFTTFDSSYNSYGTGGAWYLSWSADSKSQISATVDKNGKILSYYYYGYEDYDYNYLEYYFYSPKFPEKKGDAGEILKAFLDRVLEPGESFEANEQDSWSGRWSSQDYYSGNILYNGITTPVYINASIDSASGKCVSFYRGDGNVAVISAPPAAEAAVSLEDASALLRQALEMEAYYELDYYNGVYDKAYLRYYPAGNANYVVMADTGELVDLNTLYEGLDYYSYDTAAASPQAEASMDSGAGYSYGMTQAEQSAADEYADALTQEQLDAKARAVTQLGLDGFTFTGAGFSKDYDGVLTARLHYYKPVGDDAKAAEEAGDVIHKYITLNAKTGALISLYTNYPYRYEFDKSENPDAQKNADDFLKAYFSSQYSRSELTSAYSDYDGFEFLTYSQKVNGYLFYGNSISVSVAPDGTISSLNTYWDSGVAFDSASGVISADKAADAYFTAANVKLQYIYVPVAIDPAAPEFKTYAEDGYVYEYALAYAFDPSATVMAIDAKSGQPLSYSGYSAPVYEYSDIDSSYAKQQIQALAEVGAGFPGGLFKPDSALTQLDALVLLLSADGYTFTEDSVKDVDYIYENAYYKGLVTKSERSPDKVLTRADYVRMLIGATAYGKAAQLEDAFACDFTDADRIPEGSYGHVAIAKALGVIGGDLSGRFNPNDTITRQDAAIILYNYMSR